MVGEIIQTDPTYNMLSGPLGQLIQCCEFVNTIELHERIISLSTVSTAPNDILNTNSAIQSKCEFVPDAQRFC